MCDESGGVAVELCPEQSAAWFSTEAAPQEPCPSHSELTEGDIARQKALDGVRENLGKAKAGKAKGGFFRRLLGRD
jgi:hypothetical protein